MQDRIKCPSCRDEFRIEETLWIASHDELQGEDPYLASTDYMRFLPKHFTADRRAPKAIDPKGGICNLLACPHCHLEIPREYFNSQPFTTAVVGGRSTGKTFFLIALNRWLHSELPEFGLNYRDGYSEKNEVLDKFGEQLFPEASVSNDLVQLAGNERGDNDASVFKPRRGHEDEFPDVGDMYNYARPFMYLMNRARNDFQNEEIIEQYSLCLYDHSGERFWRENANHVENIQATKNVVESDALFFLFDPTQIPGIVHAYKEVKKQESGGIMEPYIGAEKNMEDTEQAPKNHPLAIFSVMRALISNSYPEMRKYDGQFVVILPKCDAWMCLLDVDIQECLKNYPCHKNEETNRPSGKLSRHVIDKVSDAIKRFLLKKEYKCDKFVKAVNDFASNAIYIPVSATGCQPTIEDGAEGFKPGNLHPIWIGVPFLYTLAKHKDKLIEIV